MLVIITDAGNIKRQMTQKSRIVNESRINKLPKKLTKISTNVTKPMRSNILIL